MKSSWLRAFRQRRRFAAIWLSLLASMAPATAAEHDEPETSAKSYGVGAKTLFQLWGPKESLGAWYVPPLPPVRERMQSVHVALLPSGKVLIVSGSSFRIKYEKGKKPSEFEEGLDGTRYEYVDNTGLFDPAADTDNSGLPLGKNSFRRIASPPTPSHGEINDLFCSGHLQTLDGDVLFVGGNRMNYAGMIFTGAKVANVFDWKTETWRDGGLLKDGHWYPTLVGLADGKIAAFSGLSYTTNAGNNANSPFVEFFDPRQPMEKAWTYVDLREIANGPFSAPFAGGGTSVDRMDHYPRIFALPDGRLFITGDGSGGGQPKSKNTYYMTIQSSGQPGVPPTVSFQRGPDRPAERRVYGTALIDPNSTSGDILLIGGMLGTERTTIGPEFPPLNKDQAVSADLHRFRAPGPGDARGSWELVPHFLGDRPDERRIMHIATILPNKQFLIMGGGNFAFHRPIFSPQLFTASPNAPGDYQGATMNPGTQPRLYHSVSLLLPDGRVFVDGGNACRAAVDLNTKEVYLNTYRDPTNNSFSFAEKGKYAIPAEIHQIEIFYPPYLFAAGDRPVISGAPKFMAYGQKVKLNIKNMTPRSSIVLMKLGSVTHACDYAQRLTPVSFEQDTAAGIVTIEAPTNPHTNPPGYYMMFYVNRAGKPSVAPIAQLVLPR